MVATETQLSSLSRLAVRLGTTPKEIMRVSREHDVRPAMWLDEAMYFDEDGATRIARLLHVGQGAKSA